MSHGQIHSSVTIKPLNSLALAGGRNVVAVPSLVTNHLNSTNLRTAVLTHSRLRWCRHLHADIHRSSAHSRLIS